MDVSAWLGSNWAWMAPLIYIYVTIIGMVQSWYQFKEFGINIIEFAEINDFLLAAFREPRSFIAVLGIMAYAGVSIAVSHFKNKFFSSSWMKAFAFLSIGLIAPYVAILFLHGTFDSKSLKDQFIQNDARTVDVLFRVSKESENEKGIDKGWMKQLILVGTTDKYVFFYKKPNEKQGSPGETFAAPLNNILMISCIQTEAKD